MSEFLVERATKRIKDLKLEQRLLVLRIIDIQSNLRLTDKVTRKQSRELDLIYKGVTRLTDIESAIRFNEEILEEHSVQNMFVPRSPRKNQKSGQNTDPDTPSKRQRSDTPDIEVKKRRENKNKKGVVLKPTQFQRNPELVEQVSGAASMTDLPIVSTPSADSIETFHTQNIPFTSSESVTSETSSTLISETLKSFRRDQDGANSMLAQRGQSPNQRLPQSMLGEILVSSETNTTSVLSKPRMAFDPNSNEEIHLPPWSMPDPRQFNAFEGPPSYTSLCRESRFGDLSPLRAPIHYSPSSQEIKATKEKMGNLKQFLDQQNMGAVRKTIHQLPINENTNDIHPSKLSKTPRVSSVPSQLNNPYNKQITTHPRQTRGESVGTIIDTSVEQSVQVDERKNIPESVINLVLDSQHIIATKPPAHPHTSQRPNIRTNPNYVSVRDKNPYLANVRTPTEFTHLAQPTENHSQASAQMGDQTLFCYEQMPPQLQMCDPRTQNTDQLCEPIRSHRTPQVNLNVPNQNINFHNHQPEYFQQQSQNQNSNFYSHNQNPNLHSQNNSHGMWPNYIQNLERIQPDIPAYGQHERMDNRVPNSYRDENYAMNYENNGPRNRSNTQGRAIQNERARETFLRRLRIIPKFNGESFKDLKDFLDIVNTLYQSCTNHCEELELFEHVFLQLRGEAKTVAVEFEDWPSISAALQSHFAYLSNQDILISKLDNLHQEPKESLSEYSERVRKLLRERNSTYTHLSDEQKKEHNRTARKAFAKGLRDNRLKDRLLIRGASSLEDAIAYSIEAENDTMTQVPNNELFCRACKNIGHRERDCRRRMDDNTMINSFVSALRSFSINANRTPSNNRPQMPNNRNTNFLNRNNFNKQPNFQQPNVNRNSNFVPNRQPFTPKENTQFSNNNQSNRQRPQGNQPGQMASNSQPRQRGNFFYDQEEVSDSEPQYESESSDIEEDEEQEQISESEN